MSPGRVILGGGVMHQTGLFPIIREELASLVNGYIRMPDVVPPGLGDRAGVLGALILAEEAVRE
jgi:fructokinase